MRDTTMICQDEKRRALVRVSPLNGIDYLEVSDDQKTLTVYFLDKAPQDIQKENVVILGGQRITGIRVSDITVCRVEEEDRDDCMMVEVDKIGDFSTYILCIAAIDDRKQPIMEIDSRGRRHCRPLQGFDPRYACLEFSFKAGCPSDLDCASGPACPPREFTEPDINYLAKDYASFRQLILDRLALIMPEWKERHVPDMGIALVEALAYTGDSLTYYQDATATEAYLETARQRISVRRHARLVDYHLHEGCNARTWVTLRVSDDMALSPDDFYLITDPGSLVSGTVHHHADLPQTLPRPYMVFEPLVEDRGQEIRLFKNHNEIGIYTWGDAQCCILKGATSATLIDPSGQAATTETLETGTSAHAGGHGGTPGHRLRLRKCDIVIFEEVKGPRTGNEADADPGHRHAVRLTSVTPSLDPLTNQRIVEIEWAEDDALPFPVCVSSIKEDDCSLISGVSVVRGNVVLADRGERVADDLDTVPVVTLLPECGDECTAREAVRVPGWYRPPLPRQDVTFSEPLTPRSRSSKKRGRKPTPASAMLTQNIREALPAITLFGTLKIQAGADATQEEIWEPRQDLLASGPTDQHFVVEIDNDRRPHLRFGDGETGRMPDAGMSFRAVYRVGNGPDGNIGAEALSHIVFRNNLPSGADIRPRNPFPARGGTAAEPIAEAKLSAPHAFRKELQRAITALDYADIVMRDFKRGVQRATARLRWTGSWYEVMVAVDPFEREDDGKDLLCEIAGRHHRYRRIGHDLVVKAARTVPLDIALTVCVLPHYLRGHVKSVLLDVFSNRLLPDGRKGFFHPDNLTFGEGIFLSTLVAAAQAIDGVESVIVTKMERLFEGPDHEIENGVLPLGPFEVARLDNDPGFPESGRLTFDVRGGR